MNVFLQLINIVTNTVEPSSGEKRRSGMFGRVMGFLIFALIFIPVTLLVGVIVYYFTDALMSNYDTAAVVETSVATTGFKLMLHIISAFSLIFGFNVIMSVFYFSNDMDHLLPLPISPIKIIAAKFTSTMFSENIMESLLILGAAGGFLIGYGAHSVLTTSVGIISGIIGLVTFPIVPLGYCAVICILLMYFTRFIKNKDTVSKMTTVLIVVLLALMVVAVNVAGGFDAEVLAQQMIEGDLGIFNVLDVIFVQVSLLSSAMAGNILSLLAYIIVNAAVFAVVLLLASKLYLPAVIGLNGAQGKKAKKADTGYEHRIKSSGYVATYFKKEMRILTRTPAYLMNCIGINLIWPVFIYVIIMLQTQTDYLGEFIDKVKAGDAESTLNLLLVVFCVSIILTAMNCLASSAITREGKHFEIMRHVPVNLMTQINAKALVSIVISGAGLVVYIAVAFLIFGLNVNLILYCAALSIMTVVFSTYMGIYIDTMNPKLVWDEEINALRGNYHVFYNMAISIFVAAIVTIAINRLYVNEMISLGAAMNILILFTALLTVFFYWLCKEYGIRNLMKIEM